VKLSCVILTMGTRPAELDRAVASAVALGGAARNGGVQVVLVGNGADVPPVPPGVVTVRLPENIGVAAGRNAGLAACAGDVVLFLDDDGWYPDADLGEHVLALTAEFFFVRLALEVLADFEVVGGDSVLEEAGVDEVPQRLGEVERHPPLIFVDPHDAVAEVLVLADDIGVGVMDLVV